MRLKNVFLILFLFFSNFLIANEVKLENKRINIINEKIENIYFLKGLVKLNNDLVLISNGLKNLEGLNSIEEVKGHLYISYNKIKNIDELNELKKVSGNIVLVENENLVDISGLRNLESVNAIKLSSIDIKLPEKGSSFCYNKIYEKIEIYNGKYQKLIDNEVAYNKVKELC